MHAVRQADQLMALGKELRCIIDQENIRSVFQPIVSLRDGSVLGYEALSRGPQGSAMETPDMLFSVAEENRETWDLERLCRAKALLAFQHARTGAMLFLNVNPKVIADAKFQHGFTREYLLQFGIDPGHIVFEITERTAFLNMAEFKEAIRHYKGQSYKIAIDDAGAGYSGLNLISDVQPHYLKLDMQLIRDIDKDTVKQALVRSMQEFAKITDTSLIAEGIETREELETLIHIGVHYGQGYFIKRPTALIGPPEPGVTGVVVDINAKKNRMYRYSLSEVFIGNLSIPVPAVGERMTIREAYDMLAGSPGMQGFCVTREDAVRGIVTRDMVNAAVAGVYGYSLYAKKNLSSIMDREFLSLDYQTPVTHAGKLAMARTDDKVYNFITVTAQGKYYGIVTIKDLLDKTIEIEVNNATQLNPLTGLPGNMPIENALSALLFERREGCVLYFDIDCFKAYNDVYGFENGDRIIKHLARCIADTLPGDIFLGHVGGDDFVAILQEDCEGLCKELIREFDTSIRAFYTPEDVEKGCIRSRSRQGGEENFPLISLSVAGVRVWPGRFTDVYALSAEASRVKKECKLIPGSAYLIL